MKNLARKVGIIGIIMTATGCSFPRVMPGFFEREEKTTHENIFGECALIYDLEKNHSKFEGKYILIDEESNLAIRNMVPSCPCPEFFGIAVYKSKKEAEKSIPYLNNGGKINYSAVKINNESIKKHISIWKE